MILIAKKNKQFQTEFNFHKLISSLDGLRSFLLNLKKESEKSNLYIKIEMVRLDNLAIDDFKIETSKNGTFTVLVKDKFGEWIEKPAVDIDRMLSLLGYKKETFITDSKKQSKLWFFNYKELKVQSDGNHVKNLERFLKKINLPKIDKDNLKWDGKKIKLFDISGNRNRNIKTIVNAINNESDIKIECHYNYS